MTDYFLSTENESSMLDAILSCGVAFIDSDGSVVQSEGVLISVIGRWYERTGGTDLAPEMTAVPGWFFNVRSVTPINWPASVTQTQPSTPWRMFG